MHGERDGLLLAARLGLGGPTGSFASGRQRCGQGGWMLVVGFWVLSQAGSMAARDREPSSTIQRPSLGHSQHPVPLRCVALVVVWVIHSPHHLPQQQAASERWCCCPAPSKILALDRRRRGGRRRRLRADATRAMPMPMPMPRAGS